MAAEKFSTINHFCHEHPLVLTENVVNVDCFACIEPIVSERAYVCEENPYCSNKSSSFLHQRCAELPNQISHPSHPHHPLYLFENYLLPDYKCDLCGDVIYGSGLRYRCDRCDFDTHITCILLDIDKLFGERKLDHPRHIHPLTLMRKPTFLFTCDACGIEDRDRAYSCSTCDLLIHKTCALLPPSLPTNQHHHQLSLASCFPFQFRKYTYKCAICDEIIVNRACWVYYCGDCRYFVHLKCATSTAETAKRDVLNIGENDGGDVVQFPLTHDDISNKLIAPFVMREKEGGGGGGGMVPDVKDMPTIVNMPETTASYSYLFNYHKHPLSLVSEDHDGKLALILAKEKDEDEDDDDDDDDDELKICDVCVTPISSPPYYECGACKYFVHSICYLLPKTLSSSSSSSSPLYGDCRRSDDKNHKFALYTSDEERDKYPGLYECDLCEYWTNGMVYRCEECGMIVDVKCASLPATIAHASHPSHPKLLLTPKTGRCINFLSYCYNTSRYRCSNDGCDFALCLRCALLPLTIRKQQQCWDNHHPLLLTFDASLDHPSDFFCEFCEQEMHPKQWMYHCRRCDISLHIDCVETAAGGFRNVKFGRRFELDGIHPPHPLTFNYITIKTRCDICHQKNVYTYRGFECASCNYVACLDCVDKVLAKQDVI